MIRLEKIEDPILADLQRFHGPELQKALRNAFRRGGGRIVSDAIERFRRRGLGRSIFGERASGARKIIRMGRLRVTDGSAEMDITAVGLAGLQESGGRTGPPRRGPITPKLRSALKFQVGGVTVFAASADHQGSRVPRQPFLAPALDAGVASVMDEIERAIDALILKTVAV